jgi:hypothetical protein
MPDDAITALARLLGDAAVDYALIGGHAVNVWLEPRFTADVDVTVQAGPRESERLQRTLAGAGFAAMREHGTGQPSGPDFVRFVSADGTITLEVQAAKTAFQREAIRRAHVGANGMRIATVEDLIVMKLIADRPKDQVDLLGLAHLPAVDWPYVERWAAEWQVLDRLRRIRPGPTGNP